MKYARTISLLCAMGVMLLIASAASASVVTSPPRVVYTSTIKAESEGHVVLKSENAPTPFTIRCNSSIEASVEQHGSATTVSGKVNSLSFTNCTDNITVNVRKAGSLEVHDLKNGTSTLTSSGAEIEITIHSLESIKCFYTTNNTDIGTVTGSGSTGATATLDLNSSTIPRTGGNVLCGTGGFWTGSYKITTPDYLEVSDPYSGSVATSPAGTVFTGAIEAETEGHLVLHSENAPAPFTVECNSTLKGEVEQHGTSTTASGKVNSLTFSNCTNGVTMVTKNPGMLEIHDLGNGNGLLTSTGAELQATIHSIGIICTYGTSNTPIGTLTGSKNSGATATVDLNSSTVVKTGGVFCGGGAIVTGNFKVSAPDYLDISGPYPGSVATSPSSTVYTGAIAAESTGHMVLHSENAPTGFTIECNSKVEASVEQHGQSTTAGGKVSALSFASCTNGATVIVNKTGTVEIHRDESGNGTVTYTGAEITVHVPGLSIKCIYTTSYTSIGTLTSSKNTGSTAMLDLNSAKIGRTGGSAFCGTAGILTGSYKVTSPDYLDIS